MSGENKKSKIQYKKYFSIFTSAFLIFYLLFLVLPSSAWACHDPSNFDLPCTAGTVCVNHQCVTPTGPPTPPPTEEDISKKGLKGALGLFNIFGTKAGFPEQADEPEVLVGKIIQGALVVIGVIFGILIVYAGYLWMIARGNEEMVKKAIETLQTAVIGFIIVVGAYAITAYVVGKIIPAAFPTADTEEP